MLEDALVICFLCLAVVNRIGCQADIGRKSRKRLSVSGHGTKTGSAVNPMKIVFYECIKRKEKRMADKSTKIARLKTRRTTHVIMDAIMVF